MAEVTRFGSYEELHAYLREHAEDVDLVRIHVPEVVQVGNVRAKGLGAVLELCSGVHRLISADELEQLLNDGIMERLRTKFRVGASA